MPIKARGQVRLKLLDLEISVALVACFLSIAPCLWLEWKDKSPFLLIWLLNFLFVYLPLTMFWFNGDFPKYLLFEAFVFIAACQLSYFIFLLLFKVAFNNGQWSPPFRLNLKSDTKKDILIIGVALAIPFILLCNGVSVADLLESTWADKRSLSLWYLAILYASAFLFPNVMYAFINKKWLLLLLILFVFMLVLLYFRSRSILIYMFLPIGYYLIFFNKRGLIWSFIMGCGVYCIAQIVKIIRYQGTLMQGLNLTNWSSTAGQVALENISKGDLSIASVFLFAIEDCAKSTYWCGDWSIPGKLLSKFGIITGVQKTIEYNLYDFYIGTEVGGSLHPTCFGVAYADGGAYWGIAYFIFLALLRVSIDKVLLPSYNNLIYMGFIMDFVVFFSRGSVYNALILLMVAFIIESSNLLRIAIGRMMTRIRYA